MPPSSKIPDDTYFNMLREIFQKDVDISDENWEIIKKFFKIVHTPKNTIIHNPGDIETVARFIIKGVVKATYHGEYKYIDSFMTNNDFLCDTFSLFDGDTSMYSFETISDCLWIEVVNVKRLTEMSHAMQTIFLLSINRYLKSYFEYNKQIRKQTAKEQYRQFCVTHPNVIKHAKISDIASYFGITIQSLSRIRNEIMSDEG